MKSHSAIIPQPVRTFSFTRYLAAKKTVDDRALNRVVWGAFARQLTELQKDATVQVLEVGAGAGAMLERLFQQKLLWNVHYTAIDLQPENIDCAYENAISWAVSNGFTVEKLPGRSLQLQRCRTREESTGNECASVIVRFEAIDVFDFARREKGRQGWDILVAHAFLDLLDLPTALPELFGLLEPEGIFYFSINFDGATILEPVIDPDLDNLIEAVYHQNMDDRVTGGKRSGDSRSGRHLFETIRKSGGQVWEAGSSDWVVFPMNGNYPDDEAYFLHFIIHTICSAVENHPAMDGDALASWASRRHDQVELGELVYIAHQLDFMGAVQPGAAR